MPVSRKQVRNCIKNHLKSKLSNFNHFEDNPLQAFNCTGTDNDEDNDVDNNNNNKIIINNN